MCNSTYAANPMAWVDDGYGSGIGTFEAFMGLALWLGLLVSSIHSENAAAGLALFGVILVLMFFTHVFFATRG